MDTPVDRGVANPPWTRAWTPPRQIHKTAGQAVDTQCGQNEKTIAVDTPGGVYIPGGPAEGNEKTPSQQKNERAEMTTKEDLRRAIGAIEELDPGTVAAEVSLLTGARLKSQNYESSGSRSSEHGLPLPDKLDKQTWGRDKAYRTKIQRAANLLEQALFIQGQLLARLCDAEGNPSDEARLLAAEDAGPQAENCANCARVVERTAADKLLGGRCRNCHDYLKKHGTERPKDLWVAA